MTQERRAGSFVTEAHHWHVEGMEDGKIWFTIGGRKYLFSCIEVTRLCLKLFSLTMHLPCDFRKLTSEPIEPIEDPLDQFREDAA